MKMVELETIGKIRRTQKDKYVMFPSSVDS
jgi:hypothetical protein